MGPIIENKTFDLVTPPPFTVNAIYSASLCIAVFCSFCLVLQRLSQLSLCQVMRRGTPSPLLYNCQMPSCLYVRPDAHYTLQEEHLASLLCCHAHFSSTMFISWEGPPSLPYIVGPLVHCQVSAVRLTECV